MLSDQPGLFGGSLLTFQFKHHPQDAYEAWVYPLGDGLYDIRDWNRATCSAAQQRYFRIRYPQMATLPGG
ncbi:MAG: hypothetical protein ACYCPH_03535 [Minisyncoccota bacterium]